jgi:CBS domain containing-hemolysin-like protein
LSNFDSKVKFKQQNGSKKINYQWIVTITIITLFIAMRLSYFSLLFMDVLSLSGAIVVLLVIVSLGIFFDLLGIAVTAANETPFHSMASSRVKGSKESITIIRNASSVANFFNDVIGDIAGIISGSASSAIIVKLMIDSEGKSLAASIVLGGLIAAMTVGGKAFGKEIAIRHSNAIVYRIGIILSYFMRNKKKG